MSPDSSGSAQSSAFQENSQNPSTFPVTQDVRPSTIADQRLIPPTAQTSWPIGQSPTNFLDPNKIGIPRNIQPLLYSATGFDLLSILAKVVTRPKPSIQLGPVDFTCSFCFVCTKSHNVIACILTLLSFVSQFRSTFDVTTIPSYMPALLFTS